MDDAPEDRSAADPSGVEVAVRRAAASVWRHRARAELAAAARFTRLARELSTTGAVDAVVTLARDAARDELRHAERCADLVEHFGGARPTSAAATEAAPVAPRGLSPRERVLYEVVAMSCVTETLSAALLGTMVEQATDDVVRTAMHEILADEVSHSRLGWAHLAVEHERGCADVVGEHLPAILRATVTEELFASWAEPPEQASLGGLGALDRATRKRIFEDTMRLVVFPGLARFGIEVAEGERWVRDQGV